MSKKSFLMTPDPYHTPGYCGYVPQFKYRIGETFGTNTHRLLTSTDPRVAASGNPVLSDTLPSTTHPPKTAEDFFSSPVYQNRTRSWGDQKYVAQMVPGYTGYIPKNLHNFGCRYAESCHSAFSTFEQDQQKHRTIADEMKSFRTNSSSNPEPQNNTPLYPVNSKAKPYLSSFAKQHTTMSPYNMPDDHPHKYYMSGYTGFVPKARKYLGQGYPVITRSALQEHAAEEKRLAKSWNAPIRLFRTEQTGGQPSTTRLYMSDNGLVPHYTGHVPGEKFQFGATFGTSTKNPLPELSI